MMRLIFCHEFTNADEYECIFTAKDTKGILKALW